jgi:hypothetical protein
VCYQCQRKAFCLMTMHGWRSPHGDPSVILTDTMSFSIVETTGTCFMLLAMEGLMLLLARKYLPKFKPIDSANRPVGGWWKISESVPAAGKYVTDFSLGGAGRVLDTSNKSRQKYRFLRIAARVKTRGLMACLIH